MGLPSGDQEQEDSEPNDQLLPKHLRGKMHKDENGRKSCMANLVRQSMDFPQQPLAQQMPPPMAGMKRQRSKMPNFNNGFF